MNKIINPLPYLLETQHKADTYAAPWEKKKVSEDNKIRGVVTEGNLMACLLHGRVQPEDAVESVMYRQFKKVRFVHHFDPCIAKYTVSCVGEPVCLLTCYTFFLPEGGAGRGGAGEDFVYLRKI